MLIVHVHVCVKAEYVEPFIRATIANAQESIKEPGIARFDVVQHQDDPTRFVLIEAYRTADAGAAPNQTPPYQTWRDLLAPRMAKPHSNTNFTNSSPNHN